jgi:phosphoribosylglycinamide formyltransferase-1
VSQAAPTPLELGVLVSGGGSNLQAILDAIAAARLAARCRVVISNRAGVLALERARSAGVEALTLEHRDFASREEFDRALVTALRERGVEWVALAGFMRVLTPTFLGAFEGKVVNIHPALLPSFPGVDAQEQALDYGVKVAGCTVHFVDGGVDSGPIIAQAAVPVLDDDTAESLRARILEQEHQLLPRVLQWLAEGRVRLVHGPGARPRVLLDELPAAR